MVTLATIIETDILIRMGRCRTRGDGQTRERESDGESVSGMEGGKEFHGTMEVIMRQETQLRGHEED